MVESLELVVVICCCVTMVICFSMSISAAGIFRSPMYQKMNRINMVVSISLTQIILLLNDQPLPGYAINTFGFIIPYFNFIMLLVLHFVRQDSALANMKIPTWIEKSLSLYLPLLQGLVSSGCSAGALITGTKLWEGIIRLMNSSLLLCSVLLMVFLSIRFVIAWEREEFKHELRRNNPNIERSLRTSIQTQVKITSLLVLYMVDSGINGYLLVRDSSGDLFVPRGSISPSEITHGCVLILAVCVSHWIVYRAPKSAFGRTTLKFDSTLV